MELKHRIWLLMGLIGSTQGVLWYDNGNLKFTFSDSGHLTKGQIDKLKQQSGIKNLASKIKEGSPVDLIDIPVKKIDKIDFPWYTFGGGMNLTVNGTKFKFSFLQPQNTVIITDAIDGVDIVTNLREGRHIGKEWKELLHS